MPSHLEVGGRVAELAAPVVAVHDQAFDPVRAAQHLGGLLRVALGHALPDVRRGPPHIALADELDGHHLEAELLAEVRKRVHGAHRPVPEPEVGAYDDGDSVQAVDEDFLDELRGGQLRQHGREVQDQHVIGAVLAEQLDPLIERGEHRRLRPGPHHLGRVRVERHDDERCGECVRPLASPAQDELVPTVDAVEDADGHHGPLERGRHLVETSPQRRRHGAITDPPTWMNASFVQSGWMNDAFIQRGRGPSGVTAPSCPRWRDRPQRARASRRLPLPRGAGP